MKIFLIEIHLINIRLSSAKYAMNGDFLRQIKKKKNYFCSVRKHSFHLNELILLIFIHLTYSNLGFQNDIREYCVPFKLNHQV